MIPSDFYGYDIWKLASPYDNEVYCTECGDVVYDFTPYQDEEGNFDKPYCGACLKEFE